MHDTAKSSNEEDDFLAAKSNTAEKREKKFSEVQSIGNWIWLNASSNEGPDSMMSERRLTDQFIDSSTTIPWIK